MSTRKKTKKEHSIVPVLFTLGVIGWGFFAIDRLTSGAAGDPNSWEAKSKPRTTHNAPTGRESSAWKKSIGGFLTSMGEQINKPESDPDSQYLPVINDSKLDVSLTRQDSDYNPRPRDASPPNSQPLSAPSNTAPSNTAPVSTAPLATPLTPLDSDSRREGQSQQYAPKAAQPQAAPPAATLDLNARYPNPRVYFYQEQPDGEITLKGVSAGRALSVQELFSQLIVGPSQSERENYFIDSFPVKPTVIDISVEGSSIVLNFDDNFGHGVSFRTLDLQLKQFLQTAKQFPGINSIKIHVHGRQAQSVGGDGLTIPEVIDESSWPVAYRR